MEELNSLKKDYETALEDGVLVYKHVYLQSIYRLNDILDQLENYDITFAILKSTGLVATLKKTKHAGNEEVVKDTKLQKRCSDLISRWKRDVTVILKKESSEKESSSVSISPVTPADEIASEVIPSIVSPVKPIIETLSKSEISMILNPPMMNITRTKFRNLLYNDFKGKVIDFGFTESVLVKKIGELEQSLNTEFNNGSEVLKEYREHFRDIRFNLGKNVDLLLSFLEGNIECTRLVKMTNEEMMSDDVKKEREKISQYMFEASQTNWAQEHLMNKMGGGFKCRYCGSDKTSYMQKQTRSADEPMTVFFECMKCGRRWRE